MMTFRNNRKWVARLAALMGLVLPLCAIAAGGAAPAKSDQQGNAGANSLQDRSYKSEAEKLFVDKCAMCHRNFGMGTVILAHRVEKGQDWLERRPDLTVDFVKAAARNGIGNMPRITRGDVSDEQLDSIARYLEKAGKQ